MSEVTPDGSPVAVWLALPAGDEPELIDDVVPAGSRILELGCGVGRITRVLIAFGHEVTAVDESPAMLEHVTGARTVEAPIAGLRLGERFGVVVAASHLINDADPDARAELLATCAAHVEPDGLVLLQRHHLGWTAEPEPTRGRIGPVGLEVDVEPPVDGAFAAVARYTVGRRTWEQPFRAVHLPDEMLRREAAAAGLDLAGWADEALTWAVLRPAPDGEPARTRLPVDDRIATHRLVLTALTPADADEMVGVLDDPALYTVTGGEPPTLPQLRDRYRRLAVGHSPDRSQQWLNWIVRLGGTAVGTVQATVTGTEAEVAWVIGVPWQGRGIATEATRAMVAALRRAGIRDVVAHVHPDHPASQAVARQAGLVPTGEQVDGEQRWVSPAGSAG